MNIDKYIDKTIKSVEMDHSEIRIMFEDGTGIKIWDDGQCCCENRYMSTDDDLQHLVGGKFRNVEVKDGPDEGDDDYTIHETAFLEISTYTGFITVVNHNEHNGYYGGFGLAIRDIEQ